MARALGLVLVVACAGAGGDGVVVLSEFTIDVDQSLAPGPTTLEVVNEGAFAHTVVVTAADGSVVATSDVLDGGESAELAVDLAPGEYEFTCRIVVETSDGRIIDHYAEGMLADVTVGDA